MSEEDHARISELFLDVCKLPPAEREAYLDASCKADPDLRAEVESLLSHDADIPEVLKPGGIPLDGQPETPSLPEQIGPFRIEEMLAEGGMGVVYRARQEEPIRREVAVKLIRLGIESGEVIARFETERQALALMNHPNIARVLDAGTTEHGRPYFAMEFVDGEPIKKYCEQHRLRIGERLKLFLQVCEGLQHAHQKAIIHRDIKPSNVLVTVHSGRAVPKIIDFGIAKAIDKKRTERSLTTALGQLIGTPEYMSPEQAELGGQDVDTRTDVYSLGALLYDLLVSTPPFDPQELRREGLEETLRRVREDDPPAPSMRVAALPDPSGVAARRRTDPRSLARRLRGDLDLITMKALHKEPSLRYVSPSEMAADIRRHLDHEPVLASPPGTWYRAGKLVRKHKAGFGFAVVVAVLLVGFGVTMAFQASRIARERDRASDAANTAERTLGLTMGLLEVYIPRGATGNAEVSREMLDRSLAAIERELGDQPLAQAQLLVNAGRVYRRLGLNERARGLVERGRTQIIELVGEEHPEALKATSELAYLYFYNRRFAEAEPLFLEALEGLRRELGADDPFTLETTKNLANLYTAQGNYDRSERLYSEILPRLRAVLGDDDPVTIRSIRDLGILYRASGRYDEAESLLSEALASQRRVLGSDHPFTLSSMNSLAVLYMIQRRFAEAGPLYRESLEGKRRVLGDDHPSTLKTLYNLACLAALESRRQEALRLLEEAVRRGYPGGRIAGDPDLASLREDPAFEAIVAQANPQAGGE